ncbi:MAG: DUF1801 domain-containing protein [Micropruina sp.]|nr:MAG: DUF1801 domain-containing protein [Micropruina sp.]
MSTHPAVDEYLAAQPEPQRTTLRTVREAIHRLYPDVTEGMSYGAPAFLLDGRRVAGFAGSARHLTFFPHSGSVVASLGDRLGAYRASKGAFQFPIDTPLPDDVLRLVIDARLAELGDS